MTLPVTMIVLGADLLRVYGGWVEVAGVRMFVDYRIQRGDPLGDFDFDTLHAAASAGRRLLLDTATGQVTLESA